MGQDVQIKRSRKIAGVLVPISRTVQVHALSAEEWHKDLLVSWLFQTCIRLQTSLDRRFLRYGMTLQEASVLLRCVEARRITPGQLAVALGRDKGKITRFVDHLEASKLVKRQPNARDRRYSIITPTYSGKRKAERLAHLFDQIRKELFAGVLDSDIQRLCKTLPQLYENAKRIGSKRQIPEGRRKRRVSMFVSATLHPSRFPSGIADPQRCASPAQNLPVQPLPKTSA
jgi:DNA-binding MarR family transcriptional regulator